MAEPVTTERLRDSVIEMFPEPNASGPTNHTYAKPVNDDEIVVFNPQTQQKFSIKIKEITEG